MESKFVVSHLMALVPKCLSHLQISFSIWQYPYLVNGTVTILMDAREMLSIQKHVYIFSYSFRVQARQCGRPVQPRPPEIHLVPLPPQEYAGDQTISRPFLQTHSLCIW